MLDQLNERGRPVLLRDLRLQIPDMETMITFSIFEMKREGLVSIKEIPGGHLVAITEAGKAVLSRATTMDV